MLPPHPKVTSVAISGLVGDDNEKLDTLAII